MFRETTTPTTKPLKNEAGFTIIEVLMAVTILSLGMLAYGVTSGSIMTRNTHSTKESISITLAQDLIEQLKNGNLSALTSGTQLVNEEGGTTTPTNFTRSYLVSPVGSHTCNCYYDISVTVEWNNNGNHSVTLNTQASQ